MSKQRLWSEVNNEYAEELAKLGLKHSQLELMLGIDKPRLEAEIKEHHKKIRSLHEEAKHARKDTDLPKPEEVKAETPEAPASAPIETEAANG